MHQLPSFAGKFGVLFGVAGLADVNLSKVSRHEHELKSTLG